MKRTRMLYSVSLIKNRSAFTLVELIVVIVILAILATIAFLSFSSQSSSARDSVRLSDMTSIAKGLTVYNAVGGKYPQPDSKVSITASGILLGMQGYAGNTVMDMIKMSAGGGIDPLDKETFYTYSTNPNQNRFQLLGFLEDRSNAALSLNMGFAGIFRESYAAPVSYSGRFAITRGDLLGILLQSDSMLPVQTTGSGVDILNADSGTAYKAIFANSDNDIISSGTGLLSGIVNRRSDLATDKSLAYMDDSLVGYWDFDEASGGMAYDKSRSGNHGYLTGGITPNWIRSKRSGALSFNGTGGVDIGAVSGYNAFTQIINFRYDNSSVIHNYLLQTQIGDIETYSGYLDFFTWDSRLGGTEDTKRNTAAHKISPGEWYHVAVVAKDITKADIYVNGSYITSTTITNNPGGTYFGNAIGYNEEIQRNLYGAVDEVRIYKRALDPIEIQALYETVR